MGRREPGLTSRLFFRLSISVRIGRKRPPLKLGRAPRLKAGGFPNRQFPARPRAKSREIISKLINIRKKPPPPN